MIRDIVCVDIGNRGYYKSRVQAYMEREALPPSSKQPRGGGGGGGERN